MAQAAIDAWGTPRAVEVLLGWHRDARVRTSYAGEIDYAEAMVALPQLIAGVGPLSSRSTLLVAPIYAERGIPLISATATTRKLRKLNPWVFPLAPDDQAEGAFMASFVLHSLRSTRITIVYLGADEYGQGLRDGVVEALQKAGVRPVDEFAVSTHSDFSRLLGASLRRSTPQAIVVAARAPETKALLRALGTTLPDVPLVLGDGASADSQSLQLGAGKWRPAYAVRWWDVARGDSASRAFVARYTALMGVRPTAFEAMHYDALMVAAQAVREVGPDPSAVRQYLAELGGKRPPYRGVTGPIAFNEGRLPNLVMTRVLDGRAMPATLP